MTNPIPKLAMIVLVSLFAACGGGEEPANSREALTVSPVSPGEPAPAPTCVDGKAYGKCTCKTNGNGVGCPGGKCMNCDPNQSPDGPNLACHCASPSDDPPIAPAPVQPATVPSPCQLPQNFGCTKG